MCIQWLTTYFSKRLKNSVEWYVRNSIPSTSRFPLTIHVFVYKLGINFPFPSKLTSHVAMSVSFVFDRRLFFTCFYRYKNTAQIYHATLKHFYPSSTFHICLFSLNLYVEYQVKWNFLLHRIYIRDIKIFAFQLQNHMGN